MALIQQIDPIHPAPSLDRLPEPIQKVYAQIAGVADAWQQAAHEHNRLHRERENAIAADDKAISDARLAGNKAPTRKNEKAWNDANNNALAEIRINAQSHRTLTVDQLPDKLRIYDDEINRAVAAQVKEAQKAMSDALRQVERAMALLDAATAQDSWNNDRIGRNEPRPYQRWEKNAWGHDEVVDTSSILAQLHAHRAWFDEVLEAA